MAIHWTIHLDNREHDFISKALEIVTKISPIRAQKIISKFFKIEIIHVDHNVKILEIAI